MKTRVPFEVIGAADGTRSCCTLCGRGGAEVVTSIEATAIRGPRDCAHVNGPLSQKSRTTLSHSHRSHTHSIVIRQPLELGLGTKDEVLLALTLLTGVITLGTGRTTVLQGIVHLVIFAVFLFFAVVP